MLTVRELRQAMAGLPDSLMILVRVGRHEKLHELKRIRFRGQRGPRSQQYMEVYLSRDAYPFLAQPNGVRRNVVVAVRNAAPPMGAGQDAAGPRHDGRR